MPTPDRPPRPRRQAPSPYEPVRPRPPRLIQPPSGYPKPFITNLKGAATINKNARKQLKRALKEQ